jgi:hypothetical protein
MDTKIFSSIKNSAFADNSSPEIRSILQLGLTELISGNFPKAVDLSDDIIKKDYNSSEGWGLKALSQGYLFDYGDNLFYLKSSLQSIEEFKSKSSLDVQDKLNIEALFTITVLNRTIALVNDRIGEVISLRRQAQMEKVKATVAKFSALISAYTGSQSKSDVGKILGYGGAIAGTIAASSFDNSARLLNEASKGVFGVAVANIAFTIDGAKALNRNLVRLSHITKLQAEASLANWKTAITSLYQQVIENLIEYSEELNKKNVFSKDFRIGAIHLIGTPESRQFIYLSRVLGVNKSYEVVNEIEGHLQELDTTSEADLKKDTNKMHFYAGGSLAALFILAPALQEIKNEILTTVFGLIAFPALFVYAYFSYKPIGSVGRVKRIVKSIMSNLKSFSINSQTVDFSQIDDQVEQSFLN